jgi:hypothetical protein
VDESIVGLLAGEPDELTSADVARIRGWNRVRAWRWLKSLHLRYGEEIVRRQVDTYIISKRSFADVMSSSRPIDPRVLRRFSEIVDQLREHDRRLDVHARALAKLHML